MKEFFKSFFVFGFATLIDKIIAFVFIPIYARYFSVEEFGSMELLLSFISIVSIFVFLQLETSIQRFFYELDETDAKQFISSVLFFILCLGLLVSIILSFFSSYFSRLLFSNSNQSNLIMWAIWEVPLVCFYTLSTVVLRFAKRYDTFLRIIVLSSICNVFLLSYFILFRHEGVLGFFKAQIFSLIIVVIYASFNIRVYITRNISFNSLRKAFQYAIPQMPARVGSTVNTYANRFFVNHYVSSYGLGLFAMANKIGSVFQILYQVFLMFWSQMMFDILLKENHKEVFVQILKLATSVLFMMVSLIALFSKDILELLSVKFVQGHYLIGVISFSIVLNILKEIVDVGPKYLKKTHYLSFNFAFSAILNVASLYFLIPYYGLWGVSFALLISSLSLLIASWVTSNRLYHIPFEKSQVIINSIPCILIITVDSFDLNISFSIKFIIVVFALLFYIFFIIKDYKRFVTVYSQ